MLKGLLRIFSYLYHLLFGLFLLIVGSISLFSSNLTLKLEMLPWEDPKLTYLLFWGSLAGLLSLLLAVRGRLRWLFSFWATLVFVMMAYGFFFTRYSFGSLGSFGNAVLLTFVALLAAIGSWIRPARRT